MLSEMRQRKTNVKWFHLYVKSKKFKKNRLKDQRDFIRMKGLGVGEKR